MLSAPASISDILCGYYGVCDEGGKDMDIALRHVEESCAAVVGVPVERWRQMVNRHAGALQMERRTAGEIADEIGREIARTAPRPGEQARNR